MAEQPDTTSAPSKDNCLVAECKKSAKHRGYCKSCYTKGLRHGWLKKVVTPKGELERFLRAHSAHTGQDCVLWPYGHVKKGYGIATVDGVKRLASNHMCRLSHGPPPFPKAEAAHSCGNHGCVNPNHLRWATTQENADDKRRHVPQPAGERHFSAKIDNEMARKIFNDHRRPCEIAKALQVSHRTVRSIKHGYCWNSVTGLPLRRTRKRRA